MIDSERTRRATILRRLVGDDPPRLKYRDHSASTPPAKWLDRKALLAACDRLLATEAEVLAMDLEPRDWFMAKAGHRDCFTVARALKGILLEIPLT